MNVKKIAILLMAGKGARFGSSLPKQFHRLCGKKVYLYALETLLQTGFFSDIVLVAQREWFSEIRKDLESLTHAPLHLIEGGETRQESSYKGVVYCTSLQPDVVLIHDAVRPFVSKKIIEQHICLIQDYPALNTCIPSQDTIVYAPSLHTVSNIPLRDHLLRGQTPQTFSFPLILKAHRQTKKTLSSDDCSLVLEFSQKIGIVNGSEYNLKITTELDLILAEHILGLQSKPSSYESARTLSGKKVVVTGASGGIGKEICRLLALEKALVLPLSPSSSLYPVNLTCPEQTKALFEKIAKEYGPIDALINSVGYLKQGFLDTLPPDEIHKQVMTNLLPVFYSCKYALIRKEGHIINIASSSYLKGQKGSSIYSSMKAAIAHFSQTLSEERPDLHINVLSPQRTDTPLRNNNFPFEEKDTLLRPEEVAREALDLLHTPLTGGIFPVRWPQKNHAFQST